MVLQKPFSLLEYKPLSVSSSDCAYKQIDWHSHNGELDGCTHVDCREDFIRSECLRGACSLYPHRSRPGIAHESNETLFCNRSQERHADRQDRQEYGHAAAVRQVKKRRLARKKPAENIAIAGDSECAVFRVSVNCKGEGYTCAKCTYQLQLIVFKECPENLYLVLKNSQHTDKHGNVCHGPETGEL